MSEEQGDDVFSKLDALLRKHHPDAFDEKPPPLSKPQENMSLPESPAIPVLTDEILPPEEVPDIPVLTEIVDTRQLPPLPIELDLIPEPYVPLDQESQLSEEASILLEKLGDVEKSFTEQPPQETSQPEEELIEIPAIEPLTLQPEPEPSLEVEPEPELEAEPEAAAKQALEVEPEPLAETTPTEPELLEEPVFAAPPETLAPMAPSPEPVPSEKPAQPLLTPEILEQLLDSLMEQALKKMDRQLQDTLQNRLSSQLTVALDRTLSSMLDQFAMNIEHMVREAVSQELRKQLSDKGNPD